MGITNLIGGNVMSFWSTVNNLASKVNEGAQQKVDQIEHYKMNYDRYDDERLLQMVKSASGTRKMAIMLLLKERGYGNG